MKQFPVSVWIVALGVSVLLSLPQIVAALNTPEEWQYSGSMLIPDGFRVDYNSHMAKMWQGYRGEWDYQLLFTHEDHPGLVSVQGFYVFLGWVAGLFRLEFAFTYHLARFISTVCMILSLWKWGSYYWNDSGSRWLTVIFGGITAGWGWIMLPFAADISPIEFWLSDAYNILGAFYMPHFAAAITLQIVIFLCLEAWLRQPRRSVLLLTTAALAADAIIQPYAILLLLPVIVLIVLVHILIIRDISFRSSLALLLPLLVYAAICGYQFLAIMLHPVWQGFSAQNLTLSPPPLYYLVSYLPFLLLILLAIGSGKKLFGHDTKWLVPGIWIAGVILLIYFPIGTQRRYLLGAQTPLAVLAVAGWQVLPLRQRTKRLLLIPLIASMMIAPLLLIAGNTGGAADPQVREKIYYAPDEISAADWVLGHAPIDALVVAAFEPTGYQTGGRIVALTGRRVFVGHWMETANYARKQEQLREFFASGTADQWRQEFLSETGADFVWYDAEARSIGTWNPEQADYLAAVYQSDTVIIYEVLP